MYTSILNFIRKNTNREKYTLMFCNYIPYLTAISYVGILLFLVFTMDQRIVSSIVKPLLVFLVVTIFRKVINRPRPYEALNIQPLFKHKKGESFPSRHTASAFIIALVCYSLYPVFGITLLVIASFVAITRVVAGVHYISDVIVAILISYTFWII